MFDQQASGLREALARLQEAVAELAAVDLGGCDDREILDAVVTQQRLADQLTAIHLRTLGEADRHDAYGLDGAVTLTSWYRHRTRLDPAEAARRVHAATRLPRLPLLAAALAAGEVTAGHVTAVTEAAVANRMAAIAANEATLVQLAARTTPRDVKVALRAIAEHADADGSEVGPLPACGPDLRRELSVRPTIDGLHEVRGLLDQLDAEALLTALDAADSPDPADTPADQRRSPGQRRADALGVVARAALDAARLPSVQGVKPHLLLTADLSDLLPPGVDPTGLADRLARLDPTDPDTLTGWLPGRLQQADTAGTAHEMQVGVDPGAEGPRLRWTGPLPAQRAIHLALMAKLTVVLTLGPWRVVNVGRTHRTLPAWLRGILELRHRHCRGPDCDRPAAWTEAHHQLAWDDGGDTDLNATVPLCRAHHDLITNRRWHTPLDPDTGTCTWTGLHGTTRTTHPTATATPLDDAA